MTVDVLGDGVNDEVSAEVQGLLEVRGHESVVNDEEDVARLADSSNSLDVRDLQSGVSGGLEPHELGLVGDGSLELTSNVEVNEGEGGVAGNSSDATEVALSATVDIIDGNYVRASLEEVQDGGSGGGAGGEGEAVLAVLDSSNAALKGLASGVAGTRVLEALVDAGTLLHERSGKRDGHSHSTGGGIGLLAGVDGKGGETLLSISLGLGSRHCELSSGICR